MYHQVYRRRPVKMPLAVRLALLISGGMVALATLLELSKIAPPNPGVEQARAQAIARQELNARAERASKDLGVRVEELDPAPKPPPPFFFKSP